MTNSDEKKINLECPECGSKSIMTTQAKRYCRRCGYETKKFTEFEKEK